MNDFEVGQEVILRQPGYKGSRDTSVIVTRVGRKYVYTGTGYSERKFAIDTGREDAGGYYCGTIGTPEMFAERDERDALTSAISKHLRGYSWSCDVSTDALKAIAELLKVSP